MENMNPAPATTAHPAAILAIILASYFMILLDNSVIFTALPSLQADLQLGTGELSWVQDAYTLVFGGLLLLGARAGGARGRFDLFGALSATLGVGALVFGIINTADAGWASPATCLGLGIAVAAAATVPAAGAAAAHLATQVSAALTTGSVLLLLALAVTAALILPADLAARRVLIPLGAAPAPLAEAAR